MHQDNEEAYGGYERNTDKVQTDCQPTHAAAEQILTRLVCVEQGLIPDGIHYPEKRNFFVKCFTMQHLYKSANIFVAVTKIISSASAKCYKGHLLDITCV